MSKLHVVLTEEEVTMAAIVGVKRHCESIAKGLRDAHGYAGRDGLSLNIEGACGEVAAAKALGRYWGFHCNTFKGPDLGTKLQVRTRSSHNFDLIVRDNDADDDAFLLITGVPPEYIVHGWMWGREAKQEIYRAAYGDRPPAYFVPQGVLRPVRANGA